MTRRLSSLFGTFWFALLLGFWLVFSIMLPRSLLAGDLRVGDITLEHVTVVSPERSEPMRDAVVVVHKGRIASITHSRDPNPHRSRGVRTIDGSGLFLTPGLIDGHVHLGDIPGMTEQQEAAHPAIARAAREQIPRSYLLYGFTTLIDLISTAQGMAQWKSSSEVVPDTYFCGGAALMDGYSMNYAPKPARYTQWPYMLMEPGMQAPAGIDPAMHTPEAVVAHMKADGAICVKTFYEKGFGGVHDLPVPRLETIREVVKLAHREGMPVLMHANADEAQTFALDSGVDIIAHGLWNWNQEHTSTTDITPGIAKILDRVLGQDVGWEPTIQVLYGIRDTLGTAYLSDPVLERVLPSDVIAWYRSPEGGWFRETLLKEENSATLRNADQAKINQLMAVPIDRVKHATAYLASHHGRVLFGTDTPSAPTYANSPGLNGWLEMTRLIDAGETPAQIFRSATLSNAQAFHLDQDIGTVEVGKRANLLLLKQDPSSTIDAYKDIVKVVLNGRVLDSAQLVANRPH